MSEGHFEAKHYAMRKSKDGTIISFVVHPSDMTSALNCLPIGARVMIGWSEIGDDEKPKGGDDDTATRNRGALPDNTSPHASQSDDRGAHKDEGPYLVQQCAIACADFNFQRWLANGGWVSVENAETAAEAVRAVLGIKSRAELATNVAAQTKWKDVWAEYKQNRLDQRYGGGGVRR